MSKTINKMNNSSTMRWTLLHMKMMMIALCTRSFVRLEQLVSAQRKISNFFATVSVFSKWKKVKSPRKLMKRVKEPVRLSHRGKETLQISNWKKRDIARCRCRKTWDASRIKCLRIRLMKRCITASKTLYRNRGRSLLKPRLIRQPSGRWTKSRELWRSSEHAIWKAWFRLRNSRRPNSVK